MASGAAQSGKSGKVAVVVYVASDQVDRRQELVDRHLGFWAKHPESLFVFSSSDSPIEVSADRCPSLSARQEPVNVLEYAGGYDDILAALVYDEQLSTFDAYLIMTAETVCIDPGFMGECLTKHASALFSATPYVAGIKDNEPILWNRAALIVATSRIGAHDQPQTKEEKGDGVQWARESKLAIDALTGATSCRPSIVEAGKAVEKGAIICTSVAGAATLAFILKCREHALDPNPHKLSLCHPPTSRPTVSEVSKQAPEQSTKHTSEVVYKSVAGDAKTVDAKELVPRVLRAPRIGLDRGFDVSRGSLTFVTALFDIRSREALTPEKKVCKTAAEYLRLGQKVLEWDVNLFLMVEPGMVGEIWHARDKLGFRDKTFIYPLNIEQSRYFHFIAKLQRLYDVGKIPVKYWPPKDTPLYVWCQMQKADALRRAMDLNVFHSSKFYWCDYGIAHIAQPPQPSVDHLLTQLAGADHGRLRFSQLRAMSPNETLDANIFYGHLQQCLAGGFFGAKVETMRWFIEEWEKEMNLAFELYPALDQAMFGRIFARNPERFLPVNGFQDGHRRILQPRSYNDLMSGIQSAITAKRWDEADALALEFVPRPWSQTLWNEPKLQLEALLLVAQIDKAKLGSNLPHPHVSAAIASLRPHWPPNLVALLTELTHVAVGGVGVGGGGSEKAAESKVVADPPFDGEMFARVTNRLHSWISSFDERPDKGEIGRVHSFVSDFAARRSVVESLPCLNAMLAAIAGTRQFGDRTAPLRKIPVWVLNLDRRPDRWRQMQRGWTMLGAERNEIFSEFRRFSAIDGSKEKEHLMTLPFWPKCAKLPIGAVACTASHMRMMQQWADAPAVDGQEWLLVLEDDATFSPSFLRDMTGLQHLLSAGGGKSMASVYSMIWTGYHMHLKDRWTSMVATEPMKLMNLKDNWISQGIGGTFSFLVSKAGARLVTQLLKEGYNLANDMPVDEWLMRKIHDRVRHICPSHPIVLSEFYIPNTPYDGNIAEIPNPPNPPNPPKTSK